jgi:hypothetical protein
MANPTDDNRAMRRRYVNVPASVVFDRHLEPTEKVVLIAILLYLGENAECWPKLETLGGILRRSPHQAARVINSLVAQGLILKRRGGRGRPNRYSLPKYEMSSRDAFGYKHLTSMPNQTVDDWSPVADMTCQLRHTNNNKDGSKNNNEASARGAEAAVLKKLGACGFVATNAAELLKRFGRDRVLEVLAAVTDRIENQAGWVTSALKKGWQVRARRAVPEPLHGDRRSDDENAGPTQSGFGGTTT